MVATRGRKYPSPPPPQSIPIVTESPRGSIAEAEAADERSTHEAAGHESIPVTESADDEEKAHKAEATESSDGLATEWTTLGDSQESTSETRQCSHGTIFGSASAAVQFLGPGSTHKIAGEESMHTTTGEESTTVRQDKITSAEPGSSFDNPFVIEDDAPARRPKRRRSKNQKRPTKRARFADGGATGTALNTVELVEKLLLSLPPEDILRCQLVNRFFFKVISGSAAAQHALFHRSRLAIRANTVPLEINPLLHRAFPKTLSSPNSDFDGRLLSDQDSHRLSFSRCGSMMLATPGHPVTVRVLYMREYVEEPVDNDTRFEFLGRFKATWPRGVTVKDLNSAIPQMEKAQVIWEFRPEVDRTWADAHKERWGYTLLLLKLWFTEKISTRDDVRLWMITRD